MALVAVMMTDLLYDSVHHVSTGRVPGTMDTTMGGHSDGGSVALNSDVRLYGATTMISGGQSPTDGLWTDTLYENATEPAVRQSMEPPPSPVVTVSSGSMPLKHMPPAVQTRTVHAQMATD